MFEFLSFHEHLNEIAKTVAVESGFLAWALLAGAMGVIFISLLVMNAITRRAERKKKEKEAQK